MTPLPRNYTAQAQAQAQVGGGFRSRELLPGQTAADRPDLVPRVFKLDALLTDLWATVFSDTCGREFTRKRGLTHDHIQLILDEPIPIGLMSMET
jgi:hypothetical protein